MTPGQLTIDDLAPAKGCTAPDLGWRKFVADNPRCYAEMVGRGHYCVANHLHFSVYALFEFARNLAPRWGEGPYLINHLWTHAARAMLVSDYPEFAKHLRTRGGDAARS
jgi:hypothetical protein